MRSFHIVLPGGGSVNAGGAQLALAGAALVASVLLWNYVQVLHESMAQGAQWRAEQSRAAVGHGTKPPAARR